MFKDFKKIRPGGPVSAEDYNRLLEEVQRLGRMTASPPLVLRNDGSGYHFRYDQPAATASGNTFSGCRLRHSATTQLPNNTSTVISLDDPSSPSLPYSFFDTDGYWDSGVSSHVTAPEAGYYGFGSQVFWQATATTAKSRFVRIKVYNASGTLKAGDHYDYRLTGGSYPLVNRVDCIGFFEAGAYFECDVQQDDGTTAGFSTLHAWMWLLGTPP